MNPKQRKRVKYFLTRKENKVGAEHVNAEILAIEKRRKDQYEIELMEWKLKNKVSDQSLIELFKIQRKYKGV